LLAKFRRKAGERPHLKGATAMSKQVYEIPKNSRERILFHLAEYRGHKFVDMRIFVNEDGKEPAPTKKGLAVSPTL
jgi:hypothetical protein